MSMSIENALEQAELSLGQIRERVLEIKSLEFEDEDERREAMARELDKWITTLVGNIGPEQFLSIASDLSLDQDEAEVFIQGKKDADEVLSLSLRRIVDAHASGESISESYANWIESPECRRAIMATNRDIQDESGKAMSKVFSHYISQNIHSCVRAELVVRVMMYCEEWAETEMAGRLTEEQNTEAAKALRAVMRRIEANEPPPVTAEIASKALSDRFDEIFINVKIVEFVDSVTGETVHIATVLPKGQSGFDPISRMGSKGKVANAGVIDVTIISKDDPSLIKACFVTIGNETKTQLESSMRHQFALEASIEANVFKGVTRCSTRRYCAASFYETEIANPINAKIAKGMDEKLKKSGNLVCALADFSGYKKRITSSPEKFLAIPVASFGAPDPWGGLLELSHAKACTDPVEARAMLVRRGLSASVEIIDHLLTTIDRFETDKVEDRMAQQAVMAIKGLLRAFGDTPGIDKEIREVNRAVQQLAFFVENAGGLVFEEIDNSHLIDLTPESARLRTKRPLGDLVTERHEISVRLAKEYAALLAASQMDNENEKARTHKKEKEASSPIQLAKPAVGESREAKADFGFQMSAMMDRLARAIPDAFPEGVFPEGVAARLAETFSRLALVANGKMPSVLVKGTKNKEPRYKKIGKMITALNKGEIDLGPVGTYVFETCMPWLRLDSGIEFDPRRNGVPTAAQIEAEVKKIAKGLKSSPKLG